MREPAGHCGSIGKGPDGNIWFSWALYREGPPHDVIDYGMGTFNPATCAVSQFSISTTDFPTYIAFGPDGNLWFNEDEGTSIGMFNPTTHAVSEFPLPAGYDFHLGGLTAGPDGNVWFLGEGPESATTRHQRIHAAGAIRLRLWR